MWNEFSIRSTNDLKNRCTIMYPILGRYGPFFLYSYTVVMGLGIMAAIALTSWLAQRQRQSGWFDGLLFSLAIGLIGGRIGFVWANWSYFQGRPGDIVLLWQGGLSYHGVLLAGLLALWAWSIWQKRSFAQEVDLLAPGLALMSVAGWLACWLAACAYGRETTLGLLAADLPDSFGVYEVRYQTQLMGMAFSVLTLWLLFFWRNLLPTGGSFWLALVALSGGRAIISLYRGDAMPLITQVRLDTLLDSLIAIVSFLKLWQYWLASRREDAQRQSTETAVKGEL